jgi:hypothetical protein
MSSAFSLRKSRIVHNIECRVPVTLILQQRHAKDKIPKSFKVLPNSSCPIVDPMIVSPFPHTGHSSGPLWSNK